MGPVTPALSANEETESDGAVPCLWSISSNKVFRERGIQVPEGHSDTCLSGIALRAY